MKPLQTYYSSFRVATSNFKCEEQLRGNTFFVFLIIISKSEQQI